MDFKGAIFDLDGTLLDSMGVWEEIDSAFLSSHGITPTREYTEAVASLGFAGAAEYTIARYGIDTTPQALVALWQSMAIDAYSHTVALRPGAKEYLERLAARGVRLGVATASEHCLYAPALERHGIYSLFSSFTTLKEVGGHKGEPDVYLAAAKKLGLEPAECAVFEDLRVGAGAAKRAGFYTVAVYDPASEPDEAALRAASHRLIYSYSELLKG